jgi:hypothetical protein
MRGIRSTKTKGYLAVGALKMLASGFDEDMVIALVRMCELGATHPDFGEGDNADGSDYELADEATDLLEAVFMSDYCVANDGSDCPRFEFNPKTGCIEIPYWWAKYRRRKAKPPVPTDLAGIEPVRLVLLRKPGTQN